jgi:hypothetical protein
MKFLHPAERASILGGRGVTPPDLGLGAGRGRTVTTARGVTPGRGEPEGDSDGEISDGESVGPPGLLPARHFFEDTAEEDEGDEDPVLGFIEEGPELDQPPGLVNPRLAESSLDSEDDDVEVVGLPELEYWVIPFLLNFDMEDTGDEEDEDVQIFYSDDYTDEE